MQATTVLLINIAYEAEDIEHILYAVPKNRFDEARTIAEQSAEEWDNELISAMGEIPSPTFEERIESRFRKAKLPFTCLEYDEITCYM